MISQLLQKTRSELLELGLRNTLLNHRVTKARGVSVVDSRSADIFKRVVEQEAHLTFAPLGAEVAESALKTTYEDPVLQSRLLATYYAARTHVEERGVNILFLALGMLHWYEDDLSDKELHAPLLLVPVELSRTSAREKFSLQYNDEDIEGNLSLAARLGEMGIKYPDLPEVDSGSVEAYFSSVGYAVAGQSRWRVERDEVTLGFFSFAKFLMYKDLDPGAWCSAENPDGTPILAALLRDGFRDEAAVVPEDQYLDKQIAPNVLRQVVDADSSQALAMLDVKAGANLVIQGPPGTGKSQTIANVVADAIGAGKRVLFVAEKSAALEVVKRRLDKVGLGDACLELHSHSANKKSVVAELERTLRLGRPDAPSGWSLDHYKRVRDQLNAYCLAMNTRVEGTDWTPHQLIGELAAIREQHGHRALPAVSIEAGSVLWPKATLEQKQELVTRLADLLGRLGVPNAHPLILSGLTTVLPSDRDAIEKALADGIRATSAAIAALRELGALMGIAHRCDRFDADVMVRAATRALEAPHLQGVEVRAGEWAGRRDDLNAVLEAGRRYAAIQGKYESVLIEEAWTQDLLATREVLNTVGRKWWRWLSSDYRGARRRVLGLCRGEHAKDAESQLALVDAIMDAARQCKRIDELQPLASRLFGVQWQGLKSDWDVLGRIFEWIVELYRDVGAGQCPEALVDFLDGDPALETVRPRLDELTKSVGVYDAAFRAVCEQLVIDSTQVEALKREDLPKQQARFESMVARLDDLPLVSAFNNLKIACADEQIAWVLNACLDWPEANELVVDLFRRTSLEMLLRLAYAGRPALRMADGAALAAARSTFRQLDEASLKATRLELAVKHYEGLPKLTGVGQVGVLMREFQKKKRHLPIRKLVTQAGSAMQAIKPVFMMSPMSVAAFIPPRTVRFDLVIFDEASQVKPVDSLGAVMRGDQLVVVGDSKQLPPTSFFDMLAAGDEAADDEEVSATADIESVLGLACSRGARERMLRWHYRSRHHSLITISNQQFYDNRLVVFPSPEPSSRQLGLVFHNLPKTVYDRGKTRSNQLEAEVVARAVLEHARNSPDLTLGVAAFSLPQSEAVLDHVERLRRENPSAEPFFAAHPFEPFFVKNLESVQGDERDVIFISVGYGRDAGGYVGMNFGALNGQGGERRLNVLITRARRKCEVFSNLTHEDIDTSRTSALGVAALKAFLKYAQTGIADVPNEGNGEVESPFEEEVARALRTAGHDVVHQVGSGGFRIDLAIRDPEKPGRFLLGIECDGATYHRSRSTRDRDRLRQQVLEGLGWSIHRIWSTDWFGEPHRELRRAMEAIEQAKLRSPREISSSNPPGALASPGATGEAAKAQAAVSNSVNGSAPSDVQVVQRSIGPDIRREVVLAGAPYQLADLAIHLRGAQLHEASPHRMAEWVERVAKVQGPVHFDDLARQIALAAGIQRVGSRISLAIRNGINYAARNGTVRPVGDFVWHVSADAPAVRDRSGLEAGSRKIERIAPEEIKLAIQTVVHASHGIDLVDLSIAVSRMFGLQRTTEETATSIRRAALELQREGTLKIEDDHVSMTR